MKRKVAIYARVSTEHEAQLQALSNQIQYYDDILNKHPEWELYNRYIDEGITGTSIKKRKKFIQMMRDAEEGCFDLIITREVSRFARNTVDTLQQTRNLKKLGVEVYFTEDNIWTMNDEDGELRLTIMATLAQNESKKLSQRIKAGQKITFQNGVFYGNGNILGYDYNKFTKEVTINLEQSKVVKEIFESYLNGNGTSKIKYELESKGILTSTGLKNWSASSIVRILRNPFYCGIVIYRKSYIPDYLEQKAKINKGEVDKIIVEGKHEPIISKEDFEKVQALLDKHNIVKNNKTIGCKTAKSVWSSKLICSCGSSFNRKWNHRRNKEEELTYAYQCYNQKNNGTLSCRESKGLAIDHTCTVPIIQEWKLKVMFYVIYNALLKNKDNIFLVIKQLINSNIHESNLYHELDDEIKNLNNSIIKETEKLNKVLDLFLSQILTKNDYLSKKELTEGKIKQMQEEIALLNDKKKNSNGLVEQKITSIYDRLNELFNINNDYIEDGIIEEMIDNITVRNDEYKWKLKYLNNLVSNNEEILLFDFSIDNNQLESLKNKINNKKLKNIKKLKTPINVSVYI